MSQDLVIDRVKFDGAKVRIEYQRKRVDDRYDEAVIASFDRPRPEFVAALQALAADVCLICELPADQVERLSVRGASFSHTNDVMGAVITAMKPVKTAQSPLVLNTPHIPSAPYSDEGGGPVLAEETVARLEAVINEAAQYIDGNRAQQPLPLANKEIPA